MFENFISEERGFARRKSEFGESSENVASITSFATHDKLTHNKVECLGKVKEKYKRGPMCNAAEVLEKPHGVTHERSRSALYATRLRVRYGRQIARFQLILDQGGQNFAAVVAHQQSPVVVAVVRCALTLPRSGKAPAFPGVRYVNGPHSCSDDLVQTALEWQASCL